jgi:hypothetical protein
MKKLNRWFFYLWFHVDKANLNGVVDKANLNGVVDKAKLNGVVNAKLLIN